MSNYEIIHSSVFGETAVLKEDCLDFIKLRTMIELHPVNAFGIVNKILNARSLVCKIMTRKEMMEELNA